MDGVLRPLGIGEMLDASIKIYRARWKPMVVCVALLTAPALVLSSLVSVSAGDPEALTETDPTTGLPTVDGEAMLVAIAALLVTLVITLIANNLATAGVMRIVAGQYLGEEVGWTESLRFIGSRFWRLTWVLALSTLALLAGLLVCVVGAAWPSGVFAVALPVAMVEEIGGAKAMGRSYRLVKGRFWPVLGAVIVGGLLAGVVQSIIASPAIALSFIDTNYAVQAVVQAGANIVSTAVTAPFVAVLTMVIYFDLRVRKEGFDLYVLAQRIGVDPPSGGFPAQPGVSAPSPWAMPPGWPPPGSPPPGWAPAPVDPFPPGPADAQGDGAGR